MTWTCFNTEEQLSDFLEGQLAAAERAQLQAHLVECAGCQALVAQVRSLTERLPHLEPEPEPSGLAYRILQATSGVAPQRPESTWKTILAGMFTPRFALGLGSVAATLFILFQALGVNPKKISLDDLNPLSIARAANRQAHLTYANGVRFVNDLRVVYEIRSRLEEASTTPEAQPERQDQKNTPAPQSERQLKNDLLHHGPSAATTHASAMAALLGGGL
jgi:Putative zinc-finger